MSVPDYPVLYLALGLLIASWIWFLVVAWRVDRRWFVAGLLFAGLPFPIFVAIHWKETRKPVLSALLSLVLAFAGLAYEGDMLYDRHPEEGPDRTFGQRLFGCSGLALWQRSLEKKDAPLMDFFPASLPRLDISGDRVGLAGEAAYYAALAYSTEDEVLAQAVRWGLSEQNVKVIQKDNHVAVSLASDQWILLAFRGTDDRADWLANLQFAPLETRWGTVHRGFDDALNLLWPEISATIELHGEPEKAIFLTGHSLGGALAVLASARIEREGLPLSRIVTFGQPPVGYENFAARYDRELGDKLIRVVNNVDIVEKVVTPITPLQLTHSGKLLYLDTSGRIHEGHPDFLQQLRDSVCSRTFVSNADVAAHGMQMYLTQLAGP